MDTEALGSRRWKSTCLVSCRRRNATNSKSISSIVRNARRISRHGDFLDEAKRELQRARDRETRSRGPQTVAVLRFLWRPAFVAPAFALLLFVIAYQNVVVFPRLAGESAQLDRPEILSAVSLIGGNSRGGSDTRRSRLQGPAHPAVARHSGGGAVLELRLCVDCAVRRRRRGACRCRQDQARDTVSIRVPGGQSGARRLYVDRAGQCRIPARAGRRRCGALSVHVDTMSN